MVPDIFHLWIMEATVFLGTFNAAEMFLYTQPVSELYRQFLRSHGLIFALTCNVNCGTLYRQVFVFPHHVQSNQFTTGGLQVVETSQVWKQEAPELNLDSHSRWSELGMHQYDIFGQSDIQHFPWQKKRY